MQIKKTGISPSSFTTFGSLLRYLRIRAEITQRELATKTGYHFSHVNRFEKDQRTPVREVLLARFVPALEIENEPEWVARLVELAEKNEDPESHSTISHLSSEVTAYAIPASLLPLIGRDNEIASLVKNLLKPQVRLITIIGPPGVGKTRIAMEVARKVSVQFSTGAIFVNLMPVMDPEMVLSVLIKSLGIIENSGTPQILTLQRFLQNKELLIVLDNFEQVIDAAPKISELLTEIKTIKILVTSREALRVQGEREFPLDPLSTHTMEKKSMEESPAVQLFVERASAVRPEFKLDEKNASYVTEICRRLDGLPLAIELAAARIQTFQPAEMLERIDSLFDWLTRGHRDTASWRQTLLGAIEWSHSLLNEEERILMARLAVFSGGWTLQAAEEVCHADPLPGKGQILPILTKLIDRSLVVAETSDGKTRYRYLDTIYYFSKSKLAGSNELEDVQSRHLEYFTNWAKSLQNSLEYETPFKLRLSMDVESNNIRTALEFGLKSAADHANGLALVESVGRIWLRHSNFKEALEWVGRYLPISSQYELMRSRLYFLATALSYWRNDLSYSLSYAKEGLDFAKAAHDKEIIAGILYYLGDIHRELGDIETAKKSVEESLAICRAEKFILRASMCLTSLGVILYNQEKWDEAQQNIDEAITIAVHEKSLWAQSYALRVQAEMFRFQGRFSEAFSAYERALTISSEIDDRISMGMEFANMSLVANVLGDYSISGYFAEKAFSQFQIIGNEYQQPFPQRMLAYAKINENDLEKARSLCLDSLRGNKALGHDTGVIACLVCLASILFAENNHSLAQRLVSLLVSEINSSSIKLMEPDEKELDFLCLALGVDRGVINGKRGVSKILTELGIT